MVNLWLLYGQYMVNLWLIYGYSMVNLWLIVLCFNVFLFGLFDFPGLFVCFDLFSFVRFIFTCFFRSSTAWVLDVLS